MSSAFLIYILFHWVRIPSISSFFYLNKIKVLWLLRIQGKEFWKKSKNKTRKKLFNVTKDNPLEASPCQRLREFSLYKDCILFHNIRNLMNYIFGTETVSKSSNTWSRKIINDFWFLNTSYHFVCCPCLEKAFVSN